MLSFVYKTLTWVKNQQDWLRFGFGFSELYIIFQVSKIGHREKNPSRWQSVQSDMSLWASLRLVNV